ncbi:HAD family hydrolase [Williamsia sterculiae]|uniref:HAD-superfamily subfamily IB hydrolase, TIGR01490 n=1 Tax=Williamsia sterculiae TaxID=1344003 RepID=A0A1N7CW88_9NOCA|nr:HAD-IB family hydrolase [Williamsia sterculiae]SIR67843.1 HAD-superfamily subfamily IB hydrolase, TIGR01490 [Williamsia sterculiae]
MTVGSNDGGSNDGDSIDEGLAGSDADGSGSADPGTAEVRDPVADENLDEVQIDDLVDDLPPPADDRESTGTVSNWISSRARRGAGAGAIGPVGRFRQSAAELRHSLAGEASAQAAWDKLVERAGDGDDEPGEPTHVPPDLTAAAFFDVDNTLVQGASIVHFARGLAAKNYFSYGDIMEFAWVQAKFRLTGRENADDVASGRDKALSFIAGRSTSELAELGEEIYDEYIADKIWPGTRALAQMHLDAGQQVWLVTATPVELAQTIAVRLGLTGALGTVAESVDGVFTGRLVGDILHGLGKAHAVRTLAVREGLNLKRCTAYSDSHNDVPMLSLVGTAVAINPDADLREVAKVRGWEVRDYRTARKAAKIGVPTAVVLGAAGGSAAVALRHIKR